MRYYATRQDGEKHITRLPIYGGVTTQNERTKANKKIFLKKPYRKHQFLPTVYTRCITL